MSKSHLFHIRVDHGHIKNIRGGQTLKPEGLYDRFYNEFNGPNAISESALATILGSTTEPLADSPRITVLNFGSQGRNLSR